MEPPAPLEISDLRLRLRRLRKSSEEAIDILSEIASLGCHATPLITDLIAAMQRGVRFPSLSLVPIIAKLRHASLLEAALAQKGGPWLGTFEKCELLQAGFVQFQQELLDELFGFFERDDEPRRSAIVEALAQAGTASALETLRVVQYRTAARIPELRAELNSGDITERATSQVQRGESLRGRIEFLEKVRRAIEHVAQRPDPPPQIREQALPSNLPSPPPRNITELLTRAEDDQLEFKATLRWDRAKAAVEEELERRVLQTVAGFANAKGGTLLIGVDDDGRVVGLENDYTSLKGDRDSFERHLRQLLDEGLGKPETAHLVDTSFPSQDGKEICRVDVRASLKLLFLKHGNSKEFFVRSGNATKMFNNEETARYIQQRFKQ